ncbi:hypothetical protein [Paraferrimonas sp. SM1919]|uniref:hypothetical protein n=1 Tax=Paraferrimonas sp. SM1919 TaxID=2662263 RepID=UPI001969B2C8|nr:hypothetical protein [Paraferrimonas sp. SM1919]
MTKGMLLGFVALAIGFSASAQTKIDASQAPFYNGKDVVACGVVKQTTRFKRGVYLNINERYPKQPLTLVIWENSMGSFNERFGSIDKLLNQQVCAQGTVNQYKGRSQISLYNAYSLNLSTKL